MAVVLAGYVAMSPYDRAERKHICWLCENKLEDVLRLVCEVRNVEWMGSASVTLSRCICCRRLPMTHGYYGMSGRSKFYLCDECADAFFVALPTLGVHV